MVLEKADVWGAYMVCTMAELLVSYLVERMGEITVLKKELEMV